MRATRPEPTRAIRVGLQVGYPIALTLRMSTLISRHFPRLQIEYLVSERPVGLLPDKCRLRLVHRGAAPAGAVRRAAHRDADSKADRLPNLGRTSRAALRVRESPGTAGRIQ
jgi:hypothetical protein